jgi:hypothetical protein
LGLEEVTENLSIVGVPAENRNKHKALQLQSTSSVLKSQVVYEVGTCWRRSAHVRELPPEIPASKRGYRLSGLCFRAATKELKKSSLFRCTEYITRGD